MMNLLLAAASVLSVSCLAICVPAPLSLSPAYTSLPRQAAASRAPLLSLQQEEGWTAIKSKDGMLFVWNLRDLHFSLELKGKEIKPLSDPEHIFFNVDGKVFQVQVAMIADFAPDANEKKLDDKSILAAHRDWETKFLEGLLSKSLKVQVFSAKLTGGREASLWQFDMPDGMNADARKQIYLTSVSKPYVLLLNSVATTAVSEDVARKYLLDTMATLKFSATPIDVKKLSESMRMADKS